MGEGGGVDREQEVGVKGETGVLEVVRTLEILGKVFCIIFCNRNSAARQKVARQGPSCSCPPATHCPPCCIVSINQVT